MTENGHMNALGASPVGLGTLVTLTSCGSESVPWVFDNLRIKRILSLLSAIWTSLAKITCGLYANLPTCSNPKYPDTRIAQYSLDRYGWSLKCNLTLLIITINNSLYTGSLVHMWSFTRRHALVRDESRNWFSAILMSFSNKIAFTAEI